MLSIGLATYRLARLIAIDEGPWSIFLILRARLGAFNWDAAGNPDTALGRAISCPYCVGVYAACLLYVLYLFPYLRWIVELLAVMGVQALAQSLERE